MRPPALQYPVSVRTTTSAEIYRSITGRDAEMRSDFAFNLSANASKKNGKDANEIPLIGVVTGGDVRLDWQPLLVR